MKMSLNKSIKGILFFSIVLLFSGCKNKEIKFGAAYNKKRTEVGLQEIPKQWGILKAEKDFTIFINPDQEKKPLFYSKTIRYKDNKWTDEEDIFYSGKKFETIDGHLNESLHVTYYFVPTIKGFDTLKGLQIIYTGPIHKIEEEKYKDQNLFYSDDTKMTIRQADSIFKSWGIPNRMP